MLRMVIDFIFSPVIPNKVYSVYEKTMRRNFVLFFKLNSILFTIKVKYKPNGICLTCHQTGLDTRSFYSGSLERGRSFTGRDSWTAELYGHRIIRCDVNYASFCQVFRHVCLMTLLVIASLEPKVKCYACHWTFSIRGWPNRSWGLKKAVKPNQV